MHTKTPMENSCGIGLTQSCTGLALTWLPSSEIKLPENGRAGQLCLSDLVEARNREYSGEPLAASQCATLSTRRTRGPCYNDDRVNRKNCVASHQHACGHCDKLGQHTGKASQLYHLCPLCSRKLVRSSWHQRRKTRRRCCC